MIDKGKVEPLPFYPTHSASVWGIRDWQPPLLKSSRELSGKDFRHDLLALSRACEITAKLPIPVTCPAPRTSVHPIRASGLCQKCGQNQLGINFPQAPLIPFLIPSLPGF